MKVEHSLEKHDFVNCLPYNRFLRCFFVSIEFKIGLTVILWHMVSISFKYGRSVDK